MNQLVLHQYIHYDSQAVLLLCIGSLQDERISLLQQPFPLCRLKQPENKLVVWDFDWDPLLLHQVRKETTAEEPILLSADMPFREPAGNLLATASSYGLPARNFAEGPSQFSATVVAALERSTKQNLVISSGGTSAVKCRPRTRGGPKPPANTFLISYSDSIQVPCISEPVMKLMHNPPSGMHSKRMPPQMP